MVATSSARLLGVFILAGSAFFTSTLTAAPKIIYPDNADQATKQRIDKAVAAVKKQCTGLFASDSADIESIDTSIFRDSWDGSCMSWRCDNWGWQSSMHLEIKISDDASHIPSSLRAWGHTEHVFANVDSAKKGLTVSKFPQLCGGIPNSQGNDVFIEL